MQSVNLFNDDLKIKV